MSGDAARSGWWRLLLLAIGALLCAGCAHERLIKASRPTPPAWDLLTPSPPKDGKTFLIGRSLAVNVLDERHGIQAAMNDAAYQVALAAAAHVGARVMLVDNRTGEQIRGRERTEQPEKSTVRVDVASIIMGLRQDDAYWERWSVREAFLCPKFKRYKYWVLASFPSDELQRLGEDLKKKSRTN